MNGNRPQAATAEAAAFGNAAVEGAEVQLQLQVVPSSRSESCMSLSIYRQLAWALLTRIIMHSPRTCRANLQVQSCRLQLHRSSWSSISARLLLIPYPHNILWTYRKRINVLKICHVDNWRALFWGFWGFALPHYATHTHRDRHTHTALTIVYLYLR